VNIERVDEKLEMKASKIKDFIANNNILPIYGDGRYIYFTFNPAYNVHLTFDQQAEKLKKAPFIAVDNIYTVLVADKPYYRKFGYFNGVGIKEEASNVLTNYEMKAIGGFLEHALSFDMKLAFARAISRIKTIERGDVEKRDLVLFNKTKKVYTAFENGNKIHFCTDAKERELKTEEETGRRYFLETLRKNSKKSIEEPESEDPEEADGREKVYIMQVEDFSPDFNMYAARLEERFIPLFKALEKATNAF